MRKEHLSGQGIPSIAGTPNASTRSKLNTTANGLAGPAAESAVGRDEGVLGGHDVPTSCRCSGMNPECRFCGGTGTAGPPKVR
jgi:hypothetical protein